MSNATPTAPQNDGGGDHNRGRAKRDDFWDGPRQPRDAMSVTLRNMTAMPWPVGTVFAGDGFLWALAESNMERTTFVEWEPPMATSDWHGDGCTNDVEVILQCVTGIMEGLVSRG